MGSFFVFFRKRTVSHTAYAALLPRYEHATGWAENPGEIGAHEMPSSIVPRRTRLSIAVKTLRGRTTRLSRYVCLKKKYTFWTLPTTFVLARQRRDMLPSKRLSVRQQQVWSLTPGRHRSPDNRFPLSNYVGTPIVVVVRSVSGKHSRHVVTVRNRPCRRTRSADQRDTPLLVNTNKRGRFKSAIMFFVSTTARHTV